jgi:cobalt-zinc-cadmium resistance protein CzcA
MFLFNNFPIKITKANRQLQGNWQNWLKKRKALTEYEIEKSSFLSLYQYLYGVSIQKINNELFLFQIP